MIVRLHFGNRDPWLTAEESHLRSQRYCPPGQQGGGAKRNVEPFCFRAGLMYVTVCVFHMHHDETFGHGAQFLVDMWRHCGLAQVDFCGGNALQILPLRVGPKNRAEPLPSHGRFFASRLHRILARVPIWHLVALVDAGHCSVKRVPRFISPPHVAHGKPRHPNSEGGCHDHEAAKGEAHVEVFRADPSYCAGASYL